MSRIAGRNARLYVGIASGGTAESVAFLKNTSLTFGVDTIDVTAFGDANKTYVAGLPDVGGDYGGFYDNATAQLFTAASDGVARKFYFYPDNTLATQYFFGTATFDFNLSSSVEGAVEITGNYKAATIVSKVG